MTEASRGDSSGRTLEVTLGDERFVVSIARDWAFFIENWKGWETGDLERELFSFVSGNGRSDHVFLDVGAWIGCVTLLAARKFSRVYAFEADPVSVEDLRENIRLNQLDNVVVVPKFVADSGGSRTLYSMHSGNNSGSSMFHVDGKTSWEVESIRLDEFITGNIDEGAPIVLKMDIEGAEYAVLPTLARMFEGARIDQFCLSLHPFLLARKFRGNDLLTKLKRRFSLTLNTVRMLWLLRRFRRAVDANGRPFRRMSMLSDIVLKGQQRSAHRELYLYTE